MPDKERIQRLLRTKVLGSEIVGLNTVDSTNTYLKQRVNELSDGTVVIADEQTAGIGRRGGVWTSGRSQVTFSVFLKPAGVKNPAVVPLICGLAVAKALDLLCGDGFGIKWPNDIVCQGKKICGILCESRISHFQTAVICGIGVNLNQGEEYFRANGLDHAASVKMQKGVSPDCEEAAAAILNELEPALEDCRNGGTEKIIEEYMSRCLTIGRKVRVLSGGNVMTGIGRGIAPDGSLVIRTDKGNMRVNAGEVSVRGVMGYV